MLYSLASCGMGIVMLMGANGLTPYRTLQCDSSVSAAVPPFVSQEACKSYYGRNRPIPEFFTKNEGMYGGATIAVDCYPISFLIQHPLLRN